MESDENLTLPAKRLNTESNASGNETELQMEFDTGEITCVPSSEADVGCIDDFLDPSGLAFFSGNPAIEITKGNLRLFKEEFCGDRAIQPSSRVELPERRSNLLCILSVPSYLTGFELFSFIEPFEAVLELIKVVRDSSPVRYFVIIKCRSQRSADEFYMTYHNQQFNSLESHKCVLVFLSALEISGREFEPGLYHEFDNTIELPTCPVCLERLDSSIKGVYTLLCNHSFHCNCLSRWKDPTCPVCRYFQAPQPPPSQRCQECKASENLWICLICGFIGCGRYVKGHAKEHYKTTGHTFSLELGTQRVWDYLGDGYVHRIIQSKSDGKIVSMDFSPKEGKETIFNEAAKEEIEELVVMDYSNLIKAQLESQKEYFEDQIANLAREAQGKIGKLKKKLTIVERENKKFIKDRKELVGEIKFTKELNDQLVKNKKEIEVDIVGELRKNLQKKESDNDDLREQLKDLMMHFTIQEEMEKRDDLKESDFSVRSTAPRDHQRRGSRRRGRKR